jgi:hypothetical protein
LGEHQHPQLRVEAAPCRGHVRDAQRQVVGRARGGHGQDAVAVGDGQHAEDAADVLGQCAREQRIDPVEIQLGRVGERLFGQEVQPPTKGVVTSPHGPGERTYPR